MYTVRTEHRLFLVIGFISSITFITLIFPEQSHAAFVNNPDQILFTLMTI